MTAVGWVFLTLTLVSFAGWLIASVVSYVRD